MNGKSLIPNNNDYSQTATFRLFGDAPIHRLCLGTSPVSRTNL
jgi:hypothetical protein